MPGYHWLLLTRAYQGLFPAARSLEPFTVLLASLPLFNPFPTTFHPPAQETTAARAGNVGFTEALKHRGKEINK